MSAAVFLAATHDIGKATSCFQSVITGACTDKYAEIEDSGFPLERFHFGEAVFERGYRVYPSKGGRRNHKKYQRQGYKVTSKIASNQKMYLIIKDTKRRIF